MFQLRAHPAAALVRCFTAAPQRQDCGSAVPATFTATCPQPPHPLTTHPPTPQVYGVVLPHDSDPRLAAPRSRSEPNAPGAGGSGSAPPAAGEAALAAAPPPPALPAPAESPRQGGGSPPPAGAAMLMQREATLPPVASTLPQLLPGPVANPPTIVMEFVAGRSLG